MACLAGQQPEILVIRPDITCLPLSDEDDEEEGLICADQPPPPPICVIRTWSGKKNKTHVTTFFFFFWKKGEGFFCCFVGSDPCLGRTDVPKSSAFARHEEISGMRWSSGLFLAHVAPIRRWRDARFLSFFFYLSRCSWPY